MKYLFIAALCAFSFSMKAQDVVQFKVRKDSINPVGIWVVTNADDRNDFLDYFEFLANGECYELKGTENGSSELQRSSKGRWTMVNGLLSIYYFEDEIESSDGPGAKMEHTVVKEGTDMILTPTIDPSEDYFKRIRMSPYTQE